MVKQIPMFEDSSGKAHRTEHEAWRADLALWITETGVVNDATAKQLVDKMADDHDSIDRFTALIGGISNTMPARPDAVIAQ